MGEQLQLDNPPPSGRANAKGGLSAEAILQGMHDDHLRAGIAYLHKVPTEYRVVRDLGGGLFNGRYCAKPGTDFRGVLLDGTRRQIWVECKRKANPEGRFQLCEVRDAQVKMLDDAERVRDVAVLAVFFGPLVLPSLFAIPWWWTKARKERGFYAADIEEFRVGRGELYLARWARKAVAK